MIDVYGVPNYRGLDSTIQRILLLVYYILAIMKCQIDSYPPPIIQWIKMIQGQGINQVILTDNDPQVIDIYTKQIASTIYETQLTVLVLFSPVPSYSCLIFVIVLSIGGRF